MDSEHFLVDFQVDDFIPKKVDFKHVHESIEKAVNFFLKDIHISAATVDAEEGYFKLPDTDPMKNHVAKASEEQVKRILAAFPTNLHEQAHHLNMLHQVLHAQVQCDSDKHKGEHHNHKKRHVEHFELLTNTYLASWSLLEFQIDDFKPRTRDLKHGHGDIAKAVEFFIKDIQTTAAKVDADEGNDKLADSDKNKNHVQKASEEQVKRIQAAFPTDLYDQAHHLDMLHQILHAQLQCDIDKHKDSTHNGKIKHKKHFKELKRKYFHALN
jgi:hypothetical protein